jgi:hypothetical protein
MAQEVITRLIDDLDGSDAARTVRFALDGKSYEIDLSAKNAEKLQKALAPFVEKARAAGGAGARGRRSARSSSRGYDVKAVRAWAAESGLDVSSRGRIPGDVLEKYKAANG